MTYVILQEITQLLIKQINIISIEIKTKYKLMSTFKKIKI